MKKTPHPPFCFAKWSPFPHWGRLNGRVRHSFSLLFLSLFLLYRFDEINKQVGSTQSLPQWGKGDRNKQSAVLVDEVLVINKQTKQTGNGVYA